MKTPNEQEIVGFVFTYSPVILMGVFLAIILLMLVACSSAGERAAEVCTDARLSPGTQSYENCVLRYLPTE